MTLEELRKEENEEHAEEKEESEESKEESSSEESNKSFDEALLQTISTLTEHVKSLSESQAVLEGRLAKALEEKPETQLDVKPATDDDEDIGDDVVVPDAYQSNSRQTGLDSDRTNNDGEKSPEKDDNGLSMQEKSSAGEKVNFDFTTDTPRPSAAIESVNKSDSESDLNMILKDARDGGYDGLSQVAKKILKGDYYTPTQEERLF
tara:strand:- start:12724 stop:13341 length:618 start_codon:yes stop_codon:yes gene_type:complete